MTSGARLRLIAYGICALLTATCGDAFVEALQNAGIFGATAIDRDQEGVAPVLTLVAILLVALGAAVVRDRYRRSRERNDWLAAFAHDVSGIAFASHLACVVANALVIVCLIEGYERRFGGGVPFTGGQATLGATLAGAFVYVVCAAVVTIALSRFMGALAATCDAIARLVTAFGIVLLTAKPFAAFGVRRHDRPKIGSCAAFSSRLFGDRAPPLLA